ncbi:MAG: oxygen-independent coproporphyrinogen III oxidase [Bacteroidales bacterium]
MIDKGLIKRYNIAGPRYTSYPPANHFSEKYTEKDFVQLLDSSNSQNPSNISIYLHVPFCPQICHFCGCNTSLLKNRSDVEDYFQSLEKELHKVSSHLDKQRKISQIHWGGGTPNSISFRWIERIMDLIYSAFSVEPYAEIAMEVNPAYLELSDLIRLQKMGFNRISIGVQDFKAGLLRRLNRKPSKYPIEDLYRTARKSGFKSVNIDLIYGLPGQTKKEFFESVQRAITIAPERIVTFSYAHVPWFKGNQKQIENYHIPDADEKLDMLETSYKMLTGAGYIPIGMDHYAKPDDELAVALKNKELHRNFQGYCTRETTGQVYAFGATGISQLTDGYFQNVRDPEQYIRLLNEDKFPVFRGYVLNNKEKIIRTTINELMCNHEIDIDDIAERFGITKERWMQTLNFNEDKIIPFLRDELIIYNENKIQVTPKGFFLIRNIAMAFDPMLENNRENRYSKTI